MRWRLPRSGCVGLALVLVGIALPFGWQKWLDTRTWVALDIPITLARGDVQSNEFEINLQGGYEIYAEVERKFDYEGMPCLLGLGLLECQNKPGIVKANWSVWDGPNEVARGDSEGRGGNNGEVTMGRNIGWFAAHKSRHYVVKIDVLEDGSRLDAGHPRLIVRADYWPYWEYESDWMNIILLALVLGSVGAAVLIASLVGQARERQERDRVRLTTVGPQPRELSFAREPLPEDPDHEKSARPHSLIPICLGVFLFVSGLAAFTAIESWLATRIWTPVDIPISLARGNTRTGPFKINVRAGYSITIDYGFSREPAGCFWYGNGKARWSLYRNGIHVEDFSDPSPYASLGGFEGEEGTYDLDLQIDSDTGCLNAGHPRLRISTERYPFVDTLNPWLWLSVLGITCGASLVVLYCRTRFDKESDEASVGQNFQWAQRLPLRKPFAGLPSFGLVAGLVFALTVLSYRLLMAAAYESFHTRGIYVRPAPSVSRDKKAVTTLEPLVIRLEAGAPGTTPRLYLNRVLVPWTDLQKAMQRGIGRPSDCTMFVSADQNVAWNDVVQTIDVARGLGCKVVLLTEEP